MGTMQLKDVEELPIEERDHYEFCDVCGEWYDRRDLGMVLDHCHGTGLAEVLNPDDFRGVKGEPVGKFDKIQ